MRRHVGGGRVQAASEQTPRGWRHRASLIASALILSLVTFGVIRATPWNHWLVEVMLNALACLTALIGFTG